MDDMTWVVVLARAHKLIKLFDEATLAPLLSHRESDNFMRHDGCHNGCMKR
jgi:hypothetical protein